MALITREQDKIDNRDVPELSIRRARRSTGHGAHGNSPRLPQALTGAKARRLELQVDNPQHGNFKALPAGAQTA